MAINKEDVMDAVNKLQADGIDTPSAGKVRSLLGTGGMSTIQKYLNEIRLEEAEADPADQQQQLAAVDVDPAMVANHVKTIVEHVANATRSSYLQQLIDQEAKVARLEVELAEMQESYDELAEDFEEAQEGMKEDTGAWELQNSKINALEGELEATRAAAQSEIDALNHAHKNEVLGLQAANGQLEKVIGSITKRIGVVESK